MKTGDIRQAVASDLDALYRIAADIGAKHEKNYFERCLTEQDEKKRVILVAENADGLTGYSQLVWVPAYPLFRRLDIPEIQDLNVVRTARRQGTGARLIDACEQLARQAGKTDVGISVGLYPDYGAAQRLYVKKGYIPDGAGICYDDIPVRACELKPIDDQMTLKFVKKLP